MSATILIVDDEESILKALGGILEDEGYKTLSAGDGIEALEVAQREAPDLVMLDIWMPRMEGLETLQRLKELCPGLVVIMMSGHGTIETAVKSTKMGAYDFIEKPLSLEKVIVTVNNALGMNRLRQENASLRGLVLQNHEMIGGSQPMNRLQEQIRLVAPSTAPVLINGENGTGKELVARSIHYCSQRRENPFVGDMSLKTQAKVLRILQERKFERVGGTRTIEVDVRIIAATNKVLEDEIRGGNFRADLFYRLNVVPFQIPPLRERKEDIPLLVEHFLDLFCRREGREIKVMAPEALAMMKSYDWPGNVRELKNIIERLVIITPGRTITDAHMPAYLAAKDAREEGGARLDSSLREAREEFEKEFIIQKLEENDWNISKTAEAIELERSNLHRKIKSYGINLRK